MKKQKTLESSRVFYELLTGIGLYTFLKIKKIGGLSVLHHDVNSEINPK